MSPIGIISYNINCNFTNYGSALQSWALNRSIEKLGYKPKLIDYCPDVLKNADPLNPANMMWDKDAKSQKAVEMTMPAIKENFYKFEDFYTNRFFRSAKKYTDNDFQNVVKDEGVERFVCGSDTIFCIDEFKGFVEGYYANFDCMKHNSISYAASFGDSHFSDEDYKILNQRLRNFKAIGIRENDMLEYVKAHTSVTAQRTIDPTLLLTDKDYDTIAAPRMIEDKYLLLYSRRHNAQMNAFADKIAKEKNLKVIDISLQAFEHEGHTPFYQAGVEEFLSLVKHAECVVTNSFHGIIFCVQYRRNFYGFTRQECNTKINELMALFGLDGHLYITGKEKHNAPDYDDVHRRIAQAREKSVEFLKDSLALL